MHDALAVGVVERPGHLFVDGQCLLQPQLLFAAQLGAQRLTAHQRQGVVEEPVRGPGVDERQNVRVVEVGGDLDLGQEPLGAEYGAEVGAEDLERHLAVMLQVPREVYRGHSASAELAVDPVAVGQRRGQAIERLRHYRLPLLSATRRRSSVIQLGDTISRKSSLSDWRPRMRLPSRAGW